MERRRSNTVDKVIKLSAAVILSYFLGLAKAGLTNAGENNSRLCEPGEGRITRENINARNGVGTNHQVIASLSEGQAVNIVGPVESDYETTSGGVTSKTWCEVAINGQTLFVFSRYVASSYASMNAQLSPSGQISVISNTTSITDQVDSSCVNMEIIGQDSDGITIYVVKNGYEERGLLRNQIIEVLNYISENAPRPYDASGWYEKPIVIEIETPQVLEEQYPGGRDLMGFTMPAYFDGCKITTTNSIGPASFRFVAIRLMDKELTIVTFAHEGAHLKIEAVHGSNSGPFMSSNRPNVAGSGDAYYWGNSGALFAGDIEHAGIAARAFRGECQEVDTVCWGLQEIIFDS